MRPCRPLPVARWALNCPCCPTSTTSRTRRSGLRSRERLRSFSTIRCAGGREQPSALGLERWAEPRAVTCRISGRGSARRPEVEDRPRQHRCSPQGDRPWQHHRRPQQPYLRPHHHSRRHRQHRRRTRQGSEEFGRHHRTCRTRRRRGCRRYRARDQLHNLCHLKLLRLYRLKSGRLQSRSRRAPIRTHRDAGERAAGGSRIHRNRPTPQRCW